MLKRYLQKVIATLTALEPEVVHAFILFIGFDGVLHPRTSGTFRHLPTLEEVLGAYPEIRVVISSTWKHSHELADLRGWFSPGFAHRVIGTTPDLAAGPGSRQREIEQWPRQNPTAQWLALDDESRLFDSDCVWAHLTELSTGLTSSDFRALEGHFQKALASAF